MHTPGFSFERDAGNVRGAVQDTGIDYPVGLDDEYAVWGAFASHYWPALYFADAQGRIRHHHVGEGEYQQSEMIIQRLLAEAGFGGAGHDLVSPEARGSGAPADWSHLRSPENYTGYVRAENFASPGDLIPGRPHVYEAPVLLRLNHWALSGDWTAGDEAATADTPGGQIACRFRARDLNMGPEPSDTRNPQWGSGCSWTGSRPPTTTEPTRTSRAWAPSPNRGSTSSSASTGPSQSAPSRSPSPTQASTPAYSPSARPRPRRG